MEAVKAVKDENPGGVDKVKAVEVVEVVTMEKRSENFRMAQEVLVSLSSIAERAVELENEIITTKTAMVQLLAILD